jgi:hypothetical protein
MSRMKRLFSAWRGGSAGRGAPPVPDSSQPVRVDGPGEKLIEVVTSAAGDVRVGITRDRAGLFRLRVETWAPDWESMGVATWLQRGDQGNVADSLEHARALAAEIVAEAGGFEQDEP